MVSEQVGLSNIQKELLKIYANDITEQELFEVKLLLSKYFAEKATDELNKFMSENNLSDDTLIQWTHEHNRS